MNIVITGASRGFGKAIAEKFAANGFNLYLSARRESTLVATVSELARKFPSVLIQALPADLSTKEGVKALSHWVLDQKVPIDILINNAGSFVPGSVHNEPEGALEKMIELNLYSAYHLTRSLVPGMMHRKHGHIFNICSIASLQAYKNGGAYSISKFALLGFSKNLREEMKPFNVKVTSVIPGAAYTDSWASSGIDRHRFMEAQDIAEIIYATSRLSAQACVEEIVLRPQLGDI